MKYFIGNWKMFGIEKSFKILKKINLHIKKDFHKKSYKVMFAVPYTLISNYSKKFKNSKILIGAQNCYFKDHFSSNTGQISAFMLKDAGCSFVIIGHSDNRAEGDNENILYEKVKNAINNNLNVIFCIGENKKQKEKKQTLKVLTNQIKRVFKKDFNEKKIIIAYEPIWSIGTGKIPKTNELSITVKKLKKTLKTNYGRKKNFKILYGGSVDGTNASKFSKLTDVDGFLIGGASKSDKKFIDIIKNYYR